MNGVSSEAKFKVNYRGSIGWLIFWLILFFPIAFVLLLLSSTFQINQTSYSMHYEGSLFWLCFWMVLFFPVAFVLLFVKGLSIVKETA